MYADYDYYTVVYCGNAVTSDAWPRLAVQADAYLNRITFGRLAHEEYVSEPVKMAACAVAETLQRFAACTDAGISGISGENTDGYSVTYETAAARAEARDKALREAADMYLPPYDPLRYRGTGG